MLCELKVTAEGFVRVGTDDLILREITAFMRYVGQGWEIPVTLPDRDFTQADAASFKEAFRKSYARFFGRAIDGLEGLEIVTWSVKAEDARPAPARHELTRRGGEARALATRAVFDPAAGRGAGRGRLGACCAPTRRAR
jgi:N-methylhydantoinase A